MFRSVFQNGDNGVEIFSASGKLPGTGWKISPTIHRVYDRTVKGFVFLLEKPASASMQIPEDIRDTLDIIQRYLIIQLRYSQNKSFTMEITTYDTHHQRHRYHISTKFRQIEVKPFHVQIPFIPSCEDNCWLNYILDLQQLNEQYFHAPYESLNSITIQPSCRIRKIFTLPKLQMYPNFICPTPFDFPNGITTYTQVIPEWIDDTSQPGALSPTTRTGEQIVSNTHTELKLIEDRESEMKSALAALRKKTLGKSRNRTAEPEANKDVLVSEDLLSLDQQLINDAVDELNNNPWKLDLMRAKTPVRQAPRSPLAIRENDLHSLPMPPPISSRPTTQQSQHHNTGYSDPPPTSSRPTTQQSQHHNAGYSDPPPTSSRPTTQQSQYHNAGYSDPPPPSSRPTTQQSQYHNAGYSDPPPTSSRPTTQQSQHHNRPMTQEFLRPLIRGSYTDFLKTLTPEQIDDLIPLLETTLRDLESSFIEEYGEMEFLKIQSVDSK